MSGDALVEYTDWYTDLIADLHKLEYEGIVLTKWRIGKRILEDFEKFGDPEYGEHKVDDIARDMDVGRAEIYRCIQFAREYELSSIDDNWSWEFVKRNLLPSPKEKKETPPLTKGVYRVIYADPPWKYSDELIEGYGAAEHHYRTMSIEELCEMPLPDTEENAVLFMWVTAPMADDAYRVIDAWGFEYKAEFIWDKVKHNYGHYNSVRHELLYICTKGSCLPDTPTLHDSVQQIERTEHSEKPEEFRNIIDELYTHGNKVELFARKRVDGWTAWGNELDDGEPKRLL